MTTTNTEEDPWEMDMDYGPNGPCLNYDDETDSKETAELLAAKEMVRLEAKAVEDARREETQTQELPMKVEMVQESDQGKKK